MKEKGKLIESPQSELYDREWAIRVVIDEITSSTGPTGGWLDSPKAICAAIVARLETVKRVAPCPICGKEVHGELREASQHPEPAPSLGVVHERVDAIATFDSVAQCPSSPQVTPPKYDPSWHGSQAHTFVTDKPVGSEVKPRTGDKS